MVQISDFPKNVSNALDSATRIKILCFLYDDKEWSSYSVKNDLNLNISLSSVIEHLQKLEKAGLITSKDASKGKRITYHHKITNKGKHFLKEYYKYMVAEITDKPDIANSLAKLLGRT